MAFDSCISCAFEARFAALYLYSYFTVSGDPGDLLS